jgi:CRP/FNR family transcriptional regulator, cyclic AMP receptor protein
MAPFIVQGLLGPLLICLEAQHQSGGWTAVADLKAIWYLKRTDLFSWIDDKEVTALMRSVKDREVKRGQAIYLAGEPGTVFIVKRGRVKLSRVTSDGRNLILDILEPGDLFGEMSPGDAARNDTIAEAMEDAYICGWKRDTFALLIKVNPEFALRVVEAMDEKRRKFEMRIDELLYKDVPTRLARMLLRLGDEYGTVGPEGIRIRMKLTHEDLASLIATTRETLSKFMSEFRNRGLIQYDTRQIVLLDSTGLQQEGQMDKA